MRVGTSLRQRDPSIGDDRTVPVPAAALQIRDLAASRGVVHAQRPAGIIDKEQTAGGHWARARMRIVPPSR